MERTVLWSPDRYIGIEHLHLVQEDDRVEANSVIIGMSSDRPFCTRYTVRCEGDWSVREVELELLGEGGDVLYLLAEGDGQWTTGAGEPLPSLQGCTDVDISATPFTNTLPIRRLHLAAGESADIMAAYVAIPSFRVQAAGQRYTCLEAGADRARYRYESLTSGFTAEIEVDADGLVVDYPGIFTRAWPT